MTDVLSDDAPAYATPQPFPPARLFQTAARVGEDANHLYRRADLMALCRKLIELKGSHMT